MAIDSRYVLLPIMEMQLWDKDLNVPLAAGVVSFFEDANRTVPKEVYELVGSYSGGYSYVSLGSVLTLSAIGTFVDLSGNNNVPLLYPYTGTPAQNTGIVDNYFITVYSSTGVFQFSVQAYPYAQSSGTNNANSTSANIISNPQFVEVLFSQQATSMAPVTLAITGTNTVSPIAPGWDLITTGTGSISFFQDPISITNAPTNPPYAFAITASSGFTQPIILRQRLYNTPRIFGLEYVNGTFVAQALDNMAHTLTLSYVPSATGIPLTICTGTTTTTGFTAITNSMAVFITPANTGAPPSAVIDITLTIPLGAQVEVSSVQVCGVSAANETVSFLEQPSTLQKSQLFSYYEHATVQQAKNSILVGWNFGLNPWNCVLTRNYTTLTTNKYATDQTVIIQQQYVASGSGSNVAAGSTEAIGSPLQIKAITTTSQFAVLQYIDASNLWPYWGLKMSSLVNAYLTTVNSTVCQVKMRLIYRISDPPAISQTEPIASWTAGMDPVFASGWTAIVPLNDPIYTLGITSASYPFIQFQMPAITNANMSLAIVLYTMNNLSITTAADVVNFEKVSLVPNDFALEATPKTADQVLRECQYYYETTFPSGTLATATLNNTVCAPMSAIILSSNLGCYANDFGYQYKVSKRATPNLTFYSGASITPGNVYANLYTSMSSLQSTEVALASYFATFGYNNIGAFSYHSIAGGSMVTPVASSPPGSASISYHFVADARLGIV
jgi:hypothetical protein